MGYRTARQGGFTMTATANFGLCICEDFALSAASSTKEFKSTSSCRPVSLQAGLIQSRYQAVNEPWGNFSGEIHFIYSSYQCIQAFLNLEKPPFRGILGGSSAYPNTFKHHKETRIACNVRPVYWRDTFGRGCCI